VIDAVDKSELSLTVTQSAVPLNEEVPGDNNQTGGKESLYSQFIWYYHNAIRTDRRSSNNIYTLKTLS